MFVNLRYLDMPFFFLNMYLYSVTWEFSSLVDKGKTPPPPRLFFFFNYHLPRDFNKGHFFPSRFTLSSSRNKKHAKNNFTCVACHPKEDCIATGHKDGKIRLWSVDSWRAWWMYMLYESCMTELSLSSGRRIVLKSQYCWQRLGFAGILSFLYYCSSLHRLTILKCVTLSLEEFIPFCL